MLEVCRIPSRWGSFSIWGIIFILTGIVTLLWPTLVMGIIALLFTILAFLIGIILIIVGIFAARHTISWWPLLFAGLFFIILGLISVMAPGLLATVAIVLMAALSILIGLLIIGYGIISFVELVTKVLIILLGIIPLLIGGRDDPLSGYCSGSCCRLLGDFRHRHRGRDDHSGVYPKASEIYIRL